VKRKTRQILIWSISAGAAVLFFGCVCAGVGIWWWGPWAKTPLGHVNPLGLATPDVHFEKTVTLMPGAVNRYDFPAARVQQWVSVEVDSREPVHAHITSGEFAADVRNALERNQNPTSATGKRNLKKEWFATGMPANMSIVVFLSGAQKQTDVKLTIKARPQTLNDF
jgi:hypothetical protein